MVAPALEAICLKAMARKPEDRYASPMDLAEDVERWSAGAPVLADRKPLLAALARRRDSNGNDSKCTTRAIGQLGKKCVEVKVVAVCRGFFLQTSRSAPAGQSANWVERRAAGSSAATQLWSPATRQLGSMHHFQSACVRSRLGVVQNQFSAGVPNPLAARDAIDKRFSMRKNETI